MAKGQKCCNIKYCLGFSVENGKTESFMNYAVGF
jgi:hypothetical protein